MVLFERKRNGEIDGERAKDLASEKQRYISNVCAIIIVQYTLCIGIVGTENVQLQPNCFEATTTKALFSTYKLLAYSRHTVAEAIFKPILCKYNCVRECALCACID